MFVVVSCGPLLTVGLVPMKPTRTTPLVGFPKIYVDVRSGKGVEDKTTQKVMAENFRLHFLSPRVPYLYMV